jgi:hypothetical protein
MVIYQTRCICIILMICHMLFNNRDFYAFLYIVKISITGWKFYWPKFISIIVTNLTKFGVKILYIYFTHVIYFFNFYFHVVQLFTMRICILLVVRRTKHLLSVYIRFKLIGTNLKLARYLIFLMLLYFWFIIYENPVSKLYLLHQKYQFFKVLIIIFENTKPFTLEGHESKSINFNIESIYIPYMGGWTLRSLESLGSPDLSSTYVPFWSGNTYFYETFRLHL